jgi:hypothetical protein
LPPIPLTSLPGLPPPSPANTGSPSLKKLTQNCTAATNRCPRAVYHTGSTTSPEKSCKYSKYSRYRKYRNNSKYRKIDKESGSKCGNLFRICMGMEKASLLAVAREVKGAMEGQNIVVQE